MSNTTKIVYNACYGGFGLSRKAINRYWEIQGEPCPKNWYDSDMNRTDPILVQVVEELGKKASGFAADLVIEELPKGTLYRINECDGYESIETADSVDWSVA